MLRIDAITDSQGYLFPVVPRELAQAIGLDWWAAKKLYDDKWLSFDPEQKNIDNTAMEAEFRFLGCLIASGCDPHTLKRLLKGLEKPYSYDLNRIYYDWTTQEWKDMPGLGDSEKIAREAIASLEDDEDTVGLTTVSDQVRSALEHLGETDDEEDSDSRYSFDPNESSIVVAVKKMLWKIAGSSLVDAPAKAIAVGKMFRVFQRLPGVTLDENIRVELSGPRRMFGTHEIWHYWHLELDEQGGLRVSSGGHFHRPETGGDSFSSMSWEVGPGCEPEFNDYVESLRIVDDADTFENEVVTMDFVAEKHELSVEDTSLDDFLKQDTSDDDE